MSETWFIAKPLYIIPGNNSFYAQRVTPKHKKTKEKQNGSNQS